MSDTFLDSFYKAFQMAHMAKNDQRQQEVARQQQQIHQMEMDRYARELQQQNFAQEQYQQKETQQQELQNAFKDVQIPESSVNKYVRDRSNAGTDETVITPARAEISPEMQGMLSQYHPAYQPLVKRIIQTNNMDMLKNVSKIPEDKKIEPRTLENILAEKVTSGALTLPQALRLKKQHEGGSGTNVQIGYGLGTPGGLLPGKPGELNESALSGLNPAQAATVKKIANYELPPSNYRSKELSQLLQRAALYDPTYNAAEYNTKAAVRKDFTSGKASQTILSLNTAVGHLNSLSKAADDLENGSIQNWNKFKNALITGATDDSRVTKFNTVANAVAGELATVFKNTSGTDQEIKSWHDKISSSQTPKQLRDNINECIGLIGSRLDPINNKYQQGMGKKADFEILSPKSQTILKNLGASIGNMKPAQNEQQNTAPPQGKGTDYRAKYKY